MTARPPLIVFDGQSPNTGSTLGAALARRERWLSDLLRRYPQVFGASDAS